MHNDAGSWVSNSDTGGHDRDVNRDARSQPRQKTDMVTWTCNVMQHDMQLPTHLAEQVYSMDPELPAEVIDAVFKDAGGF